jgi:DNA-directed RNA polymerase subunit RPC12/RpoP
MKCGDCGQEILQANPKMCPYCCSRNLIRDDEASKETQEIERLVKAGQYEAAALKYEELDLWDEAKDCRMQAKKKRSGTVDLVTAKVGTITLVCPHCNASQPLQSASGQEICSRCGTTYIVPNKVRELISFEEKHQ